MTETENRTVEPILPFWFKQRQGTAEPAEQDHVYKLTAPNQQEAYIIIRPGDNRRWSAAVRLTLEGADIDSTEAEFTNPVHAWDAAFELYRRYVIV